MKLVLLFTTDWNAPDGRSVGGFTSQVIEGNDADVLEAMGKGARDLLRPQGYAVNYVVLNDQAPKAAVPIGLPTGWKVWRDESGDMRLDDTVHDRHIAISEHLATRDLFCQVVSEFLEALTPSGPPTVATEPQALRKLRLWHWRQCLTHRERARELENHIAEPAKHWAGDKTRTVAYANREILTLDATALMHLGAVQVLNDFFPIGDTAENDNEPANH